MFDCYFMPRLFSYPLYSYRLSYYKLRFHSQTTCPSIPRSFYRPNHCLDTAFFRFRFLLRCSLCPSYQCHAAAPLPSFSDPIASLLPAFLISPLLLTSLSLLVSHFPPLLTSFSLLPRRFSSLSFYPLLSYEAVLASSIPRASLSESLRFSLLLPFRLRRLAPLRAAC